MDRITSILWNFFFEVSSRVQNLFLKATTPANTPLGKFRRRWAWRTLVRDYGCYISVDAQIGEGIILPHPTNIIIGEGCRLGKRVTIFQNVTIGRSKGEVDAYPTIEDDVTIYAGAVVIGGIVIGKGAIVGANSVVTRTMPPYCVCAGAPAKVVRMPAG